MEVRTMQLSSQNDDMELPEFEDWKSDLQETEDNKQGESVEWEKYVNSLIKNDKADEAENYNNNVSIGTK